MIDFTKIPIKAKTYNGHNCKKLSIIYNDEQYMLKFVLNKNNYESVISEYIGSNIYNMLGLEAQKTLLGTYIINGEKKLVVACKDFTNENTNFHDFTSIRNSCIGKNNNKKCLELLEIMDTINCQNIIDKKLLLKHFWNMFIVDAFIGNGNRHNGNWGSTI